MEIYQVTRSHRVNQKLSLRKFAASINEKLINTDVSYSMVSRWEDENQPYEPDMRLLYECLATYRDWRAQWAVDCLNAMFPDLVQSGIVKFKLPLAG